VLLFAALTARCVNTRIKCKQHFTPGWKVS